MNNFMAVTGSNLRNSSIAAITARTVSTQCNPQM